MLYQTLRTLKIFDQDNTLSLTSVGVIILLVKIACAPILDWPTAAGLLLTLLSYNFKRHLGHKKASASDVANKQLADVERKILELTAAFNVKNLR